MLLVFGKMVLLLDMLNPQVLMCLAYAGVPAPVWAILLTTTYNMTHESL